MSSSQLIFAPKQYHSRPTSVQFTFSVSFKVTGVIGAMLLFGNDDVLTSPVNRVARTSEAAWVIDVTRSNRAAASATIPPPSLPPNKFADVSRVPFR